MNWVSKTGLHLCLAGACALAAADLEDWSRFRGPNGTGIAADGGYPTEFSQSKNRLWRSKVRPGKSSPVLSRRHVFLTAFSEGRLWTQCFDRKTGEMVWERSIARPREELKHHLNEPAAPTPVTDGENVYVFFGEYGLISYDAAGKTRWQTPLGPFTNTMGLSASPILAGDRLILQADQRKDSWIAAFSTANGETIWRTPRIESESWATPLLLPADGQSGARILTTGFGRMSAHSIADGRQSWSTTGLAPAVVASPAYDHGRVYTFGYGYEKVTPFDDMLRQFDKNNDGKITVAEHNGHAWFIAADTYHGNADGATTLDEWESAYKPITAPSSLVAFQLEPDGAGGTKPKELWRYEKSFIGVIPSPMLYRGALYFVKNGGILTAMDPETGKVLKAGRLTGALGGYSSAIVAADGRLFLASEEGKISVLRAGAEWEVIATNDLGEPCYATPALSGGRVYVRTQEALYCFGAQ